MSSTLLMGRLTLPSGGMSLPERVSVAEQLPTFQESFPEETSGTRLTESTEDALETESERDEQEESGPRIVAHGVLVTPAKATEIVHEEEKVIVACEVERTEAAPTIECETVDFAAERDTLNERHQRHEQHAGLAPQQGTDADEISIPPLVHNIDLDEKFFADGDKPHEEPTRHAAHAIEADLALETENDVRAHKMTPAVRARRARFAKYVKAAVGFSAVVCLAALVRSTISHSHHDEPVTASIAAMVPVETAAAAAPPIAAEPVPAPVAAEPAPAPVAAAPAPVAAQAALDPNAPVAAAPAAGADPAAGDVPAKTAAQEKKDSRQALERGNAKVAIEAGERAVALDATDGDAWLILGAAYQEKGNLADARRCFSACVKQGKKGAVGECSAMLR